MTTPNAIEGAFAEFGHIPDEGLLSDPAFSHVTSATVRDTHTHVAGQWLRLAVTGTAPNNYPGVTGRYTYPRASFARILTDVTSAATGEVHQLSYAQFEKTPPDADIEQDLVGQNLLNMEQGSYEGRVLYLPTSSTSGYLSPEDNATYLRVTEVVSCGEYAGRYRYVSPVTDNSYDLVKSFGTYDNLKAKRSTYASVKLRPWTPADGGIQSGSAGTPSPGPAGIGLLPTRGAMAPVQAGKIYRAQVSVATERPNWGVFCQVNAYDANFNLVTNGMMLAFPDPANINSTDTTKARYNALGARRWQVAWGYVLMPANTVWAAVVPRVETGTETTQIFWADEHRLMLPTTQSANPSGASAARPWQPAQQLTVRLRANRVNYVSNPAMLNNVTGYVANVDPSLTATVTRVTDGVVKYSAQFQITGPFDPLVLYEGTVSRTGLRSVTTSPGLVERLKPSTAYTASAYVKPTFESVPITIWAHTGVEWIRGETSNIYTTSGGAPWDRIKVTFTTAETHSGTLDMIIGYAADSVHYVFGPIPPGSDPAVWAPYTGTASSPAWSATATYNRGAHVTYQGSKWEAIIYHGPFTSRSFMRFQADQVMVEEDSRLLDYFDGNFPSADYMWEQGSVAGNGRSHYYRGRTRNQYRLDRAMAQHIPLGGAYRILYATAP